MPALEERFRNTLVPPNDPSPNRAPVTPAVVACLALLTAAGALLRTTHLEAIPPFVHGDEAECGLGAIAVLRAGFRNLFSLGWYDIPNLAYTQATPFFAAFGENLFALRLSSAVVGIASILLAFGLGRELGGNFAGLVTAALVAVSYPQVAFSRIGHLAIQGPAHALLSFWLLARALRHRTPRAFFVAGLVAGLGFQIYLAARLVPALVLALVWIEALQARRRPSEALRASAWIAGGIALVLLPLLPAIVSKPDGFGSRTEQVMIWNNWKHVTGVTGTSEVSGVLMEQARRLAGFLFGESGERGTHFGSPYPAMGRLEQALVLIGIGAALWRWRRFGSAVALLWPLAVLGSAVLMIDAPAAQRIVILFPAFALLAGLGAGALLRAMPGSRSRATVVAVVTGSLVAIGIANTHRYFGEYAPGRDGDLHTEVAWFTARVSPDRAVLLDCVPRLHFGYGTIRFLAPAGRGRNLDAAEELAPAAGARLAIVACPEHASRLDEIRSRLPGGTLTEHLGPRGALFRSYLWPAESGGEPGQARATTFERPAWLDLVPAAGSFLVPVLAGATAWALSWRRRAPRS